MREILIIRFGALGDLCVLGWALARLADSSAGAKCRVTLVTKTAFAPLLADFRGVDEVIGLPDSAPASVAELAALLRRRNWDVIVDAHNTLRSHLLLGLMARRAHARLAKDTAARLGFMFFGRRGRKLDRRMLDRFHTLLDQVTAAGRAQAETPPLIHFRSGVQPSTPTELPLIGLAPGAQWDTKRWPATHFAELLAGLDAGNACRVRIFLGPREAAWYPTSPLADVASRTAGVQLIQLPDLTDVARSLAGLRLLVTNDSGLLHLAEAVDTPVLAFFGPTVREFGYFPLLKRSRVLERDESCRPCSRNGKRPCHRQDLACLDRITPRMALPILGEMLAEATV